MANAHEERDSAPENSVEDAAVSDDSAAVQAASDETTAADENVAADETVAADGTDGSVASVAADESAAASAPVYAWAPASDEPKKRKRRWPWIAIPAAGVVAGLVIASMTLIAPGVSAAGVPVGGLTQSAAANAITARVADAAVTLNTPSGAVTLTGADLGASVDAEAVAAEAFSAAPAWKFGSWGSAAAHAPIVIDDTKALAALRDALPDLYVDPIDATVTLDKATGNYSVTPATDGEGVSLDTVHAALEKAVASEKGEAAVDVTSVAIPALLTTAEAQAAADEVNALTADMGFYVGDERTVPVDPALASTWITPTIADDGTVTITADKAEIEKFTATLAAKVDRQPVDGVKLVDREGSQLPDSIYTKEGVEGRTIGDVSNIATEFAAQLESGKGGHYPLTVTTVAPKETTLERWIEVDVSEQTVYVWENGETVRVMLTSSGLPPHESTRGTFRINSHVVMQDMGCVPGYDYCTKDVKWVMYYHGDEAFHGTWWHDNFGNKMSHGCMNLSEANAKWLWDWTPIGTEVWVHD